MTSPDQAAQAKRDQRNEDIFSSRLTRLHESVKPRLGKTLGEESR